MPDGYCVVNGELLPLRTPAVPAVDRSFALGDGLFETIKVINDSPVWLSEHFCRLSASARFACIAEPDKNGIEQDCARLIEKSKIRDGFLRVTLSRGTSESGRFGDIPQKPNLVITGGKSAQADRPCRAGFASWAINETDPAVRHKTTSRFSSVVAFREARAKELDELIFFNTRGELAESIVSNIFFVKNGDVKTPSTDCGILPGITRAKVIEAAAGLSIPLEEGRFTKEEILSADEIFFTNSLSLITVCSELEGKIFQAGETAMKIGKIVLSMLP